MASARRRAAGDLPPLGPGLWPVAGTPITEPYPCDCVVERHHNRRPTEWCPCYGRTDLDDAGEDCCATRFAGDPAAAAAARARVAERSLR